MSAVLGIVRGGRIELDEPLDLPDGTAVNITLPRGLSNDDLTMTPEEIKRTLAAMRANYQPFDLPPDVAADLDEWERKINQYGIDNAERGLEDVFR